MTIEEKRKAILAYCRHHHCVECPINASEIPCRAVDVDTAAVTEMHYDLLFPDNQPTTSAVEHPGHYNREGGMECIDEMELIFGKEATMHFCLLNAWKYRYRAGAKNGAEDLKKADWYIAKYAELQEGD